MERKLALGTTAFAVLSMVLGVTIQVLIDMSGTKAALAVQTGTFLIAVPLVLAGARGVGRVTRPSVLVASIALVFASRWGIVYNS